MTKKRQLGKIVECKETLEVLRDKKAIKHIQESLREIKNGLPGTSWREIIKSGF